MKERTAIISASAFWAICDVGRRSRFKWPYLRAHLKRAPAVGCAAALSRARGQARDLDRSGGACNHRPDRDLAPETDAKPRHLAVRRGGRVCELSRPDRSIEVRSALKKFDDQRLDGQPCAPNFFFGDRLVQARERAQ